MPSAALTQADPEDIAAHGKSCRTGGGNYLREYFTELRDVSQRWARAGLALRGSR